MRRLALGFILLCASAAATKGIAVTNLNLSLPAPALARQAAPEFLKGTRTGTTVDSGAFLRLDTARTTAQGGVHTGVLESPPVARSFRELLPSWNAVTPPGTWVELEVRADLGGRWTKYYSFGRWGSTQDARRASVNGQGDADGTVLTDVLRLKQSARAYQYRLRLASHDVNVTPLVRLVTFTTTSPTPGHAVAAPSRAAWGKVLNVPARSQMVFPAGEGWCSPTSVSMIFAYWGRNVTVPEAAAGTYDQTYGGTGNWAFNAAYAGAQGFTAYATRLTGFGEVEQHILAGVPVALSLGWKKGELPGAPLEKSGGHLIVVVGFDARGNVVVNDPAGKTDAEVRRTYDRATLERLWQGHSGGVVYVIYPEHHANSAGQASQ